MDHDPLQPIIISNRRRRRPKRRPMKLGPWVLRAGVMAVGLGIAGLFLAQAFEPYTMRHRQKQETRQLLDELADAREQNKSLNRQIRMLRSGAGLDLEARRLGYIRKGEIPLQITYQTQVATLGREN
ncbi:MAG: septum formation initiator family protein [Armatimonadetes bacterium]|nr:septum formation initiator family protein [Armatimonadota bacterium]